MHKVFTPRGGPYHRGTHKVGYLTKLCIVLVGTLCASHSIGSILPDVPEALAIAETHETISNVVDFTTVNFEEATPCRPEEAKLLLLSKKIR